MSNEQVITWIEAGSLSVEQIDISSTDKAIGIFILTGFSTAVISFVGYDQDGVAHNIMDADGSEVAPVVDVANSVYIPLNPQLFAGLNKIRVRRGTGASPATTGAETKVSLVRRRY